MGGGACGANQSIFQAHDILGVMLVGKKRQP